MKPLLIIFFPITFFSFSYAQTNIGVRTGFNYSTARAYFNDTKQSTRFVPGANFGLQLETVFEGILHFAPSISYNTRGFVIRTDSSNDQTRSLIHYVNIAPILNFHFNKKGKNGFMISAGPSMGVAISGKQKIRINGTTTTSKMKFSTTGDYGLFDIILHAGFGYNFKKIFIDVAYDHGLASINNKEETDKRNIRNRTFSINLGYYFRSYQ